MHACETSAGAGRLGGPPVHAEVDHLLDLGVVLADLVERAVAEQISAAVPDPQHGEAAAAHEQDDGSRAHLLAVRRRLRLDLRIRLVEGFGDLLAAMFELAVELELAERRDDHP